MNQFRCLYSCRYPEAMVPICSTPCWKPETSLEEPVRDRVRELSNHATDSLRLQAVAWPSLLEPKDQGREIAEKIAWLVSLRRLILTELLIGTKEFLMVLMRFDCHRSTGAASKLGPMPCQSRWTPSRS